MNRAQRCDGHKRHHSEGGLGCIIMRTTCGHFGTSVCWLKPLWLKVRWICFRTMCALMLGPEPDLGYCHGPPCLEQMETSCSSTQSRPTRVPDLGSDRM